MKGGPIGERITTIGRNVLFIFDRKFREVTEKLGLQQPLLEPDKKKIVSIQALLDGKFL